MRTPLRLLVLVSLLTVAAASPSTASAQGRGSRPGSGVELWGILGWGSGAGLGVGYHTPLVPEGLLRGSSVRDSLDLDLGVDWLSYWGYHVGPNDYGWSQLNLHGGLRWDLWLTPELAVYPKAGLGFGTGWYTGRWNTAYGDRRDIGGLYPEIAVGAALKVRRDLTLRAELGAVGLKVGLGFEF